MEPGWQGRKVPASQEVATGFHKGRNTKGHDMSTELSTNTTPARGLALATMDDAFRFSQMVSKSEFAPKDFRGKPESCLLAIQHGAEIGLSPMQALQSIAVINGKPSVYGDTALAVCRGSAVCEYVRERIEGDGDKMTAICEAKRRGDPEPVIGRFSVSDAKVAGLWGKSGPWSQYSRRMLQMRARGFALRDAFPDILRGVVTTEEAQDYPALDTAREPVVTQVKTEPVKQQADERADPYELAKVKIESETAIPKLDAMRLRIDQRLKEKVFTPFQADELLDMIHARVEFLESASEVTA